MSLRQGQSLIDSIRVPQPRWEWASGTYYSARGDCGGGGERRYWGPRRALGGDRMYLVLARSRHGVCQ